MKVYYGTWYPKATLSGLMVKGPSEWEQQVQAIHLHPPRFLLVNTKVLVRAIPPKHFLFLSISKPLICKMTGLTTHFKKLLRGNQKESCGKRGEDGWSRRGPGSDGHVPGRRGHVAESPRPGGAHSGPGLRGDHRAGCWVGQNSMPGSCGNSKTIHPAAGE